MQIESDLRQERKSSFHHFLNSDSFEDVILTVIEAEVYVLNKAGVCL